MRERVLKGVGRMGRDTKRYWGGWGGIARGYGHEMAVLAS